MSVLALDPGNRETAWVRYDDGHILSFGKEPNEDVMDLLRGPKHHPGEVLAIEMIASYGMAVGKEVFETCVWIGRFIEAWAPALMSHGYAYVYRRDVKLHLCETVRATDANIRAALIDRYGGTKEKAIGVKKSPGPLYGIKADIWAALACAITYAEREPVPAASVSEPPDTFIEACESFAGPDPRLAFGREGAGI